MTFSPKANLQLIYVSDIARSTQFYQTVFNASPVFTSPRYVAFSAGGDDTLFAIWTGGQKPDTNAPRFSEIGIMLASDDEVDGLFEAWQQHPEFEFIQKPTTEVFGRTFLVKDPDGHILRVCRMD